MSENGGNERKVSDTKAKMMMFEKASKVKVLTDEEQRKKAKFNAKLGRFEAAAAASSGSNGGAPSSAAGSAPQPLERKTSEVLGKAKYFVDVAAAGAPEDEKKKQGRLKHSTVAAQNTILDSNMQCSGARLKMISLPGWAA